jgi:rod shape-determining protein MreD
MARAPRTRIGREPSTFKIDATPILMTVAGSMLALLPIIATVPLLPPLGLMMLVCWRLLHRNIWPAWVGLPLGLWDDMLSGQPTGSAMLIWTLIMLGLDLADRRMVWRDFWQDWILASAIFLFAALAGLLIANFTGGNTSVIVIIPQSVMTIALYPLIARTCGLVDVWRLPR